MIKVGQIKLSNPGYVSVIPPLYERGVRGVCLKLTAER